VGVTVVLGATVDTIARTAAGKLEVLFSSGAKFQPVTILFAAGRAANTEGLDLDAAGVKTDSRGRIVVDEHFRTSAASVFAAGDVLGPTLASVAMEQGRAAARIISAQLIRQLLQSCNTSPKCAEFAAFPKGRQIGRPKQRHDH
jgi:pyruvate/2-oxoglutarate dehydrogenase complex dihydrolipoamide dehydrogenase (E3) component